MFQMANHSYLLKAVFVIGYVSGAAAGYYAFRLFRQSRLSRLVGTGGSFRWVSPASVEKSS
jgi:hypothetical protein